MSAGAQDLDRSSHRAGPSARRFIVATLVLGLLVLLAGTLAPPALEWAYAHRADSRVAALLVSPGTTTPLSDYLLLNQSFHAQNTGAVVLLVAWLWSLYAMQWAYHSRKSALGPALAICALLSFALLGEGTTRIVHVVRSGSPFGGPRTLADPVLGWLGLRANLGQGRPRVLIVGDSFTDGVGIPLRQVYASVLQRSTQLPVAVRAASGWGTLQELLALQRVERELGFVPSHLIVQMTWNDLVNNSFEMERHSVQNPTLRARPFWIDGQAELRHGHATDALASYSAALAWVMEAYMRTRRHASVVSWWHGPEEEIVRLGVRYPPFQRSEDLTAQLLIRLVRASHGAQVVAFPATLDEPYLSSLRRIAARADVPFLEDIPREIEAAAQRGVQVRQPEGMHWGEAGHEIVGEALARWLRKSAPPPRSPEPK